MHLYSHCYSSTRPSDLLHVLQQRTEIVVAMLAPHDSKLIGRGVRIPLIVLLVLMWVSWPDWPRELKGERQ